MYKTEKIEIKSTQNELVKYCVKLQTSKFRKDEKVILIDGIKTIEGLIENNFEFEYFFTEKENIPKKIINAKQIIITNKEILTKISTTKSYSKYVGIIKEPEISKENFKKMSRIALIDGIKDAGNLGTIIRSAVAFGIDGIILYGNCVDLYNSKVIRSSAQNMFKIPIIKTNDIELIKKLKKTHTIISTVVNSKNNILNEVLDKKCIISFGSEANGISEEILLISDKLATIPMKNTVESLNLAISASIVFALMQNKI